MKLTVKLITPDILRFNLILIQLRSNVRSEKPYLDINSLSLSCKFVVAIE